MLSPSLGTVPRILHLGELSVTAPSAVPEAPCFWCCNAMSVLRKVILDAEFICFGLAGIPLDLGVITFLHY